MANSQGEGLVTPSTRDGVNITTADTAALDLDLNIVVSERLHIELLLVKLCPGLRRLDLEAAVFIVGRHYDS
jgi:hypothetical protein